jgi:hypothetical protein
MSLKPAQRDQFSEALQRVAGDEELLISLAEIASEDAPPLLDSLSKQVEDGEAKLAAQTGHALKGLLSTYETGSPVEELQAVIDLARANDVPSCQQLFRSIVPSLQRLLRQINQLAVQDHA